MPFDKNLQIKITLHKLLIIIRERENLERENVGNY